MSHAPTYGIAAFFNGFLSLVGNMFSGFFGFIGYALGSLFGFVPIAVGIVFAPDQVLEQADRMRAAAANANSFFILDSFQVIND